jgi:hypothetical protein
LILQRLLQPVIAHIIPWCSIGLDVAFLDIRLVAGVIDAIEAYPQEVAVSGMKSDD